MESPMYINYNQYDHKKGTVDADMMLNYNIPAQKYEVTEEEENPDDSSKVNTTAANKVKFHFYYDKKCAYIFFRFFCYSPR